MALTLYLLNKKGYKVLTALTKTNKYLSNIDLVVGARDKGNEEDYFDEIRVLCNNYNIKYIERGQNLTIQSEHSLAIGWRWLIKDQKNLIVLHDSFLPKYRGFSPTVNMLINGETYIGASAIWANDKMDEGDIIFQKKVNITYPLKIQKAIELIANLYVDIVLYIMNAILEKNILPSLPQMKNDATYSIWRNEDDYYIDWAKEAAEIVRFVDAVGYPYGGAKSKTEDGEIIRIRECEVVHDIISEIPAPGKLLMYDEEYPIILCGKKAVKLLVIEDLNNNPFVFKKFRTQLK
ncbi:methionyl-tRNA formyltransferase [Gillisia mitskevichiae]|uniref:Methionyl-tRNA formyltransferase n=1 Tax=Gillisia mitskevichiae TaxID=270921 RepID=A0A495PL71_9FLAO|nr:formyltransferase family protein [Gillisia mitskevichiae]RKS50600.1 methionyl-tRNA formyltransferase [Gillisia mitskevichiae]